VNCGEGLGKEKRIALFLFEWGNILSPLTIERPRCELSRIIGLPPLGFGKSFEAKRDRQVGRCCCYGEQGRLIRREKSPPGFSRCFSMQLRDCSIALAFGAAVRCGSPRGPVGPLPPVGQASGGRSDSGNAPR